MIDAHERIGIEDSRERPAALVAHLEAEIVEAEDQTVDGALRHADREHPRQPAAHGEVLIRIDERVDQLPDPLFRDFAEREDRVVGDAIPRQQRDHMRGEAGREPLLPVQDLDDAFGVARAEPGGILNLRVEGDRRRRAGCALDSLAVTRALVTPVGAITLQRLQHQGSRRAVHDVAEIDLHRAVAEAGLERLDVPAVQPPCGQDRADRAGQGR